MRHLRCLSLALVAAMFPMTASGDDSTQEIEQLRREVQALRQAVRELREALEQQGQAAPAAAAETEREKALEAEIRAAMPQPTPGAAAPTGPETAAAPAAQPAIGPGVGKSSSILNPDISLNGDFTFFGTDNKQLNKANRFSFREAEIGFQAPIDPFARADAFVTFGEGEAAEIEEAYATFLTLPFNLQARAGKFRVSFGKNNLLHRHALPQTDRPFAEAANFGEEGLAGTGAGVSYLVPNPWDQYFLLTAEVVNGLGEEIEEAQGVPLEEPATSRAFRDFVYVGHAQSFFDLDADNNIEMGGSVLFSLPKHGDQTKIYGVDLTYRWRPLGQAGYRQFLWRSEGYFTQQEVRSSDSAAGPAALFVDDALLTEDGTLDSAGFYTYGEYRLTQRIWLGTRVDWDEIPAHRHDTEWGVHPYLTVAPTEFGYFRLGYQYAESDRLEQKRSHRVWLQYNFSLGPHAAHAF